MSESASVESIDMLVTLRRAIFKFIDAVNVALTDSESELGRTLMWLEGEQATYWKLQHRKRTELVTRCREAVREKQIFKDATGSRSSAVDEIKQLKKALALLEEAEQKMAAVKRYRTLLQKEIMQYKGMVQRLASTVQGDLKIATAELDHMVQTLQGYVSLNSTGEAPEVMTSQASAETITTSTAPPEPPLSGRPEGPPSTSSAT